MEKQLLQNVNPIERIATLDSSADMVEEFSYTKPFTPDQLVIFKDQLFKGLQPETLEVETFAQVNGREISFTLISPAANQTMEELRDKAIDTEIKDIRKITPDIAIIEV